MSKPFSLRYFETNINGGECGWIKCGYCKFTVKSICFGNLIIAKNLPINIVSRLSAQQLNTVNLLQILIVSLTLSPQKWLFHWEGTKFWEVFRFALLLLAFLIKKQRLCCRKNKYYVNKIFGERHNKVCSTHC